MPSIRRDATQRLFRALDNPRLTNHSARKRLVQTLVDNGVAPTEIVQISGHKNLQSINNYSHLSEGRMENISSIISGNVVDVSSCSQSMTHEQLR